MSVAAELPLDQLDVITPDSFQNHGYPHEAWARLRRESPIHYYGEAEVPFYSDTEQMINSGESWHPNASETPAFFAAIMLTRLVLLQWSS